VPVVIVDAENVRRSLWPNLSREDLVERARTWAAGEGHELRIVFDGDAPEQAPDLVSSRYGDDEIVRLADKLAAPAWVVTSDRALREHLPASVECVIGGGSFARLLSEGP